MWILKAKQQKTTVFLTAEPDDSLKTLKQQLQTALYDTSPLEETITIDGLTCSEKKENMIKEKKTIYIQLRIHGILQTDDNKSLQEAGLQDGDTVEFSRQQNGEWEPFEIEAYPE